MPDVTRRSGAGGTGSPSVTAKSVVFDIADNWGYASFMGVRSIDFFRDGVLLALTESDFSAYATSCILESSYDEKYTFDTSKSKTGSTVQTQWASDSGQTTNQRLIVVFDVEQTFDEIVVNNAHNSGGSTNLGAKNVKVTTSTDSITDTTYNATVTNSTDLGSSTWPQHTAVDQAEDQSVYGWADYVIVTSGAGVEQCPYIGTSNGVAHYRKSGPGLFYCDVEFDGSDWVITIATYGASVHPLTKGTNPPEANWPDIAAAAVSLERVYL